MTIAILKGDITAQSVDAIVNSANPSLLAGGGVCGAIHKAAGPELEVACRAIGGCKVGQAVLTPAFKLSAKFIIHAVGPRWLDGTRGESQALEQCYESIFRIADTNDIQSLAIPSISTGIYHYPIDQASKTALDVARRNDRLSLAITFICFDEPTYLAYQKAMSG